MSLTSTAPHLRRASRMEFDLADWGEQPDALEGRSHSSGQVLSRNPEVGVWRCTPGRWRLALKDHELCHFMEGRATYLSDTGQLIAVEPGTVVHFKPGWTGECTVEATMDVAYIRGDGGLPSETKVLRGVLTYVPNRNWGPIPTMLEGVSETSGVLLSKEPDGRAESGIWICTPGTWACHVTSDEFCHFLTGRCTYTHEGGEVIEVEPDTLAFFPKDWRGVCQVHETVRKVYFIR